MTVLFWFIVLATAASAVMVVAARNILHAAFSLCLCFLGVAGIYIFLHADFVAAVQLIVYVGGILILILFAIMFSTHTQEGSGEGRRALPALAAGAGVGGVIFAAILMMMQRLRAPLEAANRFAGQDYKHTVNVAAGEKGLGHLLLGEYLLPFEVVSILILAALIGAVVIVRKETR